MGLGQLSVGVKIVSDVSQLHNHLNLKFLVVTVNDHFDELCRCCTARIHLDSKFSVSHQTVKRSHFVKGEVEDICEHSGRWSAGVEMTCTVHFIFATAGNSEGSDSSCIKIGPEKRVTTRIACRTKLNLELSVESNFFLGALCCDDAISGDFAVG